MVKHRKYTLHDLRRFCIRRGCPVLFAGAISRPAASSQCLETRLKQTELPHPPKLDNNGDLLHNTPNIIPLSAPGKESAYDFDRNGGPVGSNRY